MSSENEVLHVSQYDKVWNTNSITAIIDCGVLISTQESYSHRATESPSGTRFADEKFGIDRMA